MKKLLLYVVAIPCLCLLILGFLGLSYSPSVTIENNAALVDNADTINPLMQHTQHVLQDRFVGHDITIEKQQANSLVGFLNRAHPRAALNLNFFDRTLDIAASYQLNDYLYVNIQTKVIDAKGLQLDGLYVGQVYFPGNSGLWLAEWLVDWYTRSEIATEFLASINSIKITPDQMLVNLEPLHNALRQIREVDFGGETPEKRAQKARIAHYLKHLQTMPAPQNASLYPYLAHVMQEASRRSYSEPPILENQAAILALAVYTGDRRFAAVIGNMDFAIASIPTSPVKTRLHNRVDLSLHFIFSAAIKLLSEQGLTLAIGELKELMDRAKGGSGYSFVDLAADMAGVHFAVLASDPRYAKFVQKYVDPAFDESIVMPAIDGLEEGMSKLEFEQKYGSVDSQRYKEKVALIEERIKALPISQG